MNKFTHIFIALILVAYYSFAQEVKQPKNNPEYLETNILGQGIKITLEFNSGPEIYYPLMAVWIEDMKGNYIQTLYVAKSIAKSYFKYGIVDDNRWESGPKRIPAALPYWSHKRGIKAKDGYYLPTKENPIIDAYTGATPTDDFILKTKTDTITPNRFKILFEINQSWDWNEYWTNDKYPDDKHYKTSAQPAVVYAAEINLESDKKEYKMEAIGHSHFSGKNGNLYPDLTTLTTALEIANKIIIKINK
ncbi:MAG: hypothetical protein ACQERU_01035 [Bacteroidota bacterium]